MKRFNCELCAHARISRSRTVYPGYDSNSRAVIESTTKIDCEHENMKYHDDNGDYACYAYFIRKG